MSRSFQPGRRLRAFIAAIGALALLSAGVVADAATRRGVAAAALDARRAAVRGVGLGDLALSSSARWIRHPTQAEPGAPFQDLPSTFDVDPAGAVVGPPAPRARRER
ncbi:MAG: hypothetical protein KF901_25755 [Myxococcales bacterium]|nr:hypothetical protein [Myxococcales bacterium]